MGLYQMFARAQGWSVEVMSMDTGGGDIGGLKGLKEGVIAIKGDDCFTKLRFESGVHRVRRSSALSILERLRVGDPGASTAELRLRLFLFCLGATRACE